ncbi:DedA family protein [Alicyclobacillus acidoterrestris]|uniref:DedA family protein n=1 Tax=Alicyclobacillus acidoterrestris TaxID=1450 RepID=UPI003F534E5A
MNSIVMHWVQSGGYIGVFLAMVLESACIPLPSEVVMPFGGYLAFRGHLHLGIVILMGVLGNVVGSLISYYVGKFGGRAVIRRYGRYVRLSERHMDAAERWFRRRGDWVVFVGRLLPAIRTFISLPAGIAKMNAVKFTAYSAAGSLPWVAVLGYAGYKLGQDWDSMTHYVHPLIYVAVILVVGFIGATVYKKRL